MKVQAVRRGARINPATEVVFGHSRKAVWYRLARGRSPAANGEQLLGLYDDAITRFLAGEPAAPDPALPEGARSLITLKHESRQREKLVQGEAMQGGNAPDAALDPEPVAAISAWLIARV
jgi:hypothetical protein